MRVGSNPQKQERKIKLSTHHRVVVVVYIPNEEGFYKDSFDVFKLCIDSLVSTINSNAALTIVNNGSHKKISDFLNLYLAEKKIDTLISHNTNIGKIDALIGAARGAREQYITLTDSDILFVKGWQEKVEEVFTVFPNVGSVSPIPVRTGLYAGTSSVLKQILLRKIKYMCVSIPENYVNYNKYLESINWDLDIREDENWPVVEKKGVRAVIGSGHQVLTVDRDVLFKTTPSNPSLTLVGSNSEHNYVDLPIDKAGKLRLSTYNNYAFHMGNTIEKWMIDVQGVNVNVIKNTENNIEIIAPSPDLFNSKSNSKWYGLKKMIIKKIFSFFITKN
ncbi:glycosyltransferase family A protein [Flavobacterium gawalongense]|uniref:Glycosyltransferase family 2 protein n=1 Tax=Flavobacterium gawalongense TaxID=2594432 RepID=A0A553BYT5_9FLAO|nr:glycosyltransferase family A protein [Flavobacterium gawalongense]TRX13481.1 glycosyltransferase family 2 protein [Flavobacterium gawalongense]TRX15587.1 glycosyltransferase family 2 protein [Flavobacterium gawalongense]TRX31425.1 glycosyltransferase family 2 protein [Flavobacterium gawalongense]